MQSMNSYAIAIEWMILFVGWTLFWFFLYVVFLGFFSSVLVTLDFPDVKIIARNTKQTIKAGVPARYAADAFH